MNSRREFDIAYVGLKPGIHEYFFSVDDKFFAQYQVQDFSNCNVNIKLTLDRKNSFLQLKFDIDGKADVACDRCSNLLTKQLWDEFNIIVKMVDNPDVMNIEEEDPDIYYISRGESHIRIADWIYEFVTLSIPMQKMCSKEEMGGPQCNKEILAKLEAMENEIKKITNPQWKGLDKLKGLDS